MELPSQSLASIICCIKRGLLFINFSLSAGSYKHHRANRDSAPEQPRVRRALVHLPPRQSLPGCPGEYRARLPLRELVTLMGTLHLPGPPVHTCACEVGWVSTCHLLSLSPTKIRKSVVSSVQYFHQQPEVMRA